MIHQLLLCSLSVTGIDHVDAIEHKRLDIQCPKLGSKILLKRIDVFPNGVLLLAPDNCIFLGGCVKELEARQTCLHSILQAPAGGRRGPPLKLQEYVEAVYVELENQIRDTLDPQRPEEQNRNDAPVPAAIEGDNFPNREGQVAVQNPLEDGVEYESDSFVIEESPEVEPPECLNSYHYVGQTSQEGPLLIEETEPHDDGALEAPCWDEPTAQVHTVQQQCDVLNNDFDHQMNSNVVPHAALAHGAYSGDKRSMEDMSKPDTPLGMQGDVLKSLTAMSETFAALKKRRASRE